MSRLISRNGTCLRNVIFLYQQSNDLKRDVEFNQYAVALIFMKIKENKSLMFINF